MKSNDSSSLFPPIKIHVSRESRGESLNLFSVCSRIDLLSPERIKRPFGPNIHPSLNTLPFLPRKPDLVGECTQYSCCGGKVYPSCTSMHWDCEGLLCWKESEGAGSNQYLMPTSDSQPLKQLSHGNAEKAPFACVLIRAGISSSNGAF